MTLGWAEEASTEVGPKRCHTRHGTVGFFPSERHRESIPSRRARASPAVLVPPPNWMVGHSPAEWYHPKSHCEPEMVRDPFSGAWAQLGLFLRTSQVEADLGHMRVKRAKDKEGAWAALMGFQLKLPTTLGFPSLPWQASFVGSYCTPYFLGTLCELVLGSHLRQVGHVRAQA